MLIGFLSDAHGHTDAFLRGVSLLRAAGAEHVFFLGDAVGYIPDAGVVRALRRMDIAAVRGNHDEMMMNGSAPPGDGHVYRHGETMQQLSPGELAFVEGWPIQRSLSVEGCRCLLVHGSPSAPLNGYVYPDTDLSPFRDVDADIVLMGHTHHPFIREEYGRLFVNVGSCGLPREAGRRASACLLDPAARQARILRYAIALEAAQVLADYDLDAAVVKLLTEAIALNQDETDDI
jgi:putative phosphoesterase